MFKIQYITTLMWSLLLTGMSFPLIGQGDASVSVNTPAGVFVLLGSEFPKTNDYIIHRINSKGEKVELGEVSGPETFEDLFKRHEFYASLLNNLIPMKDSTLRKVWNHYQTNNSKDGLILSEMVLSHLSLGLAYLDTTAMDGSEVQYEISRKNENGNIIPLYTSQFHTIEIDPSITPLSHNYFDQELRLQWKMKKDPLIYSFKCFRRSNLRGVFSEVPVKFGYKPEGDSVTIFVTDSSIEKHQIYEYYLNPIDAYGNIRKESEINKGITFSYDDFPILEYFKVRPMEDRKMEVYWKMDTPPFLRSLELLRSMRYEGPYSSVTELAPTDTSYVDVIPLASEGFYYRLIMNGPLGISDTTVMTFGLYTETRIPGAPKDITAVNTESGVKLQWKDIETNTMGFYVYKRNTDGGDWKVASALIPVDTSRSYEFIDTTKAIKNSISYLYAVKSMNDSYLLSPFSDSVDMTIVPDSRFLAPSKLKVVLDGDQALVSWNDLAKFQKGVVFYRLYRQSSLDEDFVVLSDTIKSYTNHYEDSDIEKGVIYAYKVQALALDGRESGFSEVVYLNNALPKPIAPSKVFVSKNGSDTVIRWTEVRMKSLKGYKIYIENSDGDINLLGTVEGNVSLFNAGNLQDSGLLKIYVSTINLDEIESDKSSPVLYRN